MCDPEKLQKVIENEDLMSARGQMLTLERYLDLLGKKIKREASSLASEMKALSEINHNSRRAPSIEPDISPVELQNRLGAVMKSYQDYQNTVQMMIKVRGILESQSDSNLTQQGY